MQLTGDRFTSASALFGNDLSTLPDFPAEIRAPAGTLAGVSAFQVHIADFDILTPGDVPSVLVAMNPAALKANIADLAPGGTLIVNVDAFEERNLAKAGYAANPLHDDSLKAYKVYEVPMTSLTLEAAKPTGAKPRDAERSKNFFALGRDLVDVHASRRVDDRVDPGEVRRAVRWWPRPTRSRSRRATTSARPPSCSSRRTRSSPPRCCPAPTRASRATPRSAWGLIAASELSGLPVFLGSYPITPASDILHELSRHKNFGVRTLQAEDEIAGVNAALGAAFAGHLGVTTTSGPGIDLKSETVGLAVSLELPLLIIDIQRGGPSTGLPTKTEQSDLLHVMFGRHGEAPVPIVAAMSPSHCFYAAIEAARIALKYRTPVFLLSDGYLANGSEPWRLPDVESLPDISVPVRHRGEPRRRVHALPARPRDAGAPVGDPRHARASSTASAGWRRPTSPATSPTTPTTTSS